MMVDYFSSRIIYKYLQSTRLVPLIFWLVKIREKTTVQVIDRTENNNNSTVYGDGFDVD